MNTNYSTNCSAIYSSKVSVKTSDNSLFAGKRFIKYLSLALLMLVVGVSESWAGTKYWIATTNVAWTTTTAWSLTSGGGSCGCIPVASDDVFIGGTATTTISAVPTISLLTLTVRTGGGASVTLNGTNAIITITGTGSNVLLLSNSLILGTTVSITMNNQVSATGSLASTKLLTVGANTFTWNSGGTFTNSSTAANFSASTGTINFNYAGAQTVPALTVTGTGKLVLGGSGAKNLNISISIGATSTLSLQGTATTLGTAPTYAAGGTLEYNGSSAQTVSTTHWSSATTTANVTINNANGVTSDASSRTCATLTMTSGNLTLGTGDFAITTLSGSGFGTSKMIITSSTSGIFQYVMPTGAASYSFPIGENVGTPGAEYCGFTLTVGSNTVASRKVGFKVVDNANPPSLPAGTVDYTTRYYVLKASSTATTFNWSANLPYFTTDVTGTESKMFTGYASGATWAQVGTVNTSTHVLTIASGTATHLNTSAMNFAGMNISCSNPTGPNDFVVTNVDVASSPVTLGGTVYMGLGSVNTTGIIIFANTSNVSAAPTDFTDYNVGDVLPSGAICIFKGGTISGTNPVTWTYTGAALAANTFYYLNYWAYKSGATCNVNYNTGAAQFGHIGPNIYGNITSSPTIGACNNNAATGNLVYSEVSGEADQYNIFWQTTGANAVAAGFANVPAGATLINSHFTTAGTLTSPITITVPAGVAPGTYYGKINTKNSNYPWTELDYNGGGIANLQDVIVTVTAGTAAPTGTTPQAVCPGATVADLVATGTAIQWYAAATGGSPLATSTPLVNGTHYYASQTVTGCESVSRLDVTTVLPLSNTVTVGTTGTYPSLTGAGGLFADINTRGLGGNLTVTILDASIAETGANSLNSITYYCGSGPYTVTISPNTGVAATLSGAATAGSPLININGADYVTFDGLNTGGSSLIIQNTTSSATSGTSTIKFIGGSTNNVITNCTVLGTPTMAVGTNGGIIFFSTDANTANGNDNNTISNCTIGPVVANLPALPSKGIYGKGSATSAAIGNSGIIIDNNNFYDIFSASVASACIYSGGGCNTWSITNNKFYQTGTRTWTSGANHRVIDINNSTATSGAQGFTITGNIIGYASSSQTGTYTLTGSTGSFIGINFNGFDGGTVSNINNNTVASVSLSGVTSSGLGSTPASPFMGIQVLNGLANTNNNTIGSQSATGSLIFSTTTASSTDVIGIYNYSIDNWTSDNNTIGGISATNASSGTTVLFGFRANTSITDTWSATGNTVGGTVANSIQLTATGTSSQVIGMITNNAIATLTSNTVRNLTTNIGTGTVSASSMIGISVSAITTNHTLTQNTVHSLSNTAAAAVNVVGLFYSSSSGTNVVERNFIHSLSASNTAATITGINIGGSSVVTVKNNLVRLGIDASGTDISTALNIEGIRKGSSSANNIYFNSVYIGGTGVGTTASNTMAFRRTTNNVSDNVRNNIFVNVRSNGSTGGTHYAYYQNAAGTYTLNYNVYLYSGTGGKFGFNGADVAAYTTNWYSGDANSQAGDPAFINPTGNSSAVNLHIHATNPSYAEGSGTVISGIDFDYDNDDRTLSGNTPTDVGADAGAFTPAACLTPTLVTASNVGSATVDIGWTNPTSGSPVNYEWEIRTSGAGGSGSTGLTTSGTVAHPTNSVTGITTGLVSSTTYNIYVRTDCGSSNYSSWVGPVSFTTTPSNNDCANAIALIVNSSTTCSSTTAGNSFGATQSLTGCTGNANDDIWYYFTATATAHTITATPGTLTNVVMQIYTGGCVSLTSMVCQNATTGANAETASVSGLTIGDVYLVRVYSNGVTTGTVTLCVTTPPPPPANDACSNAVSLTPHPTTSCGTATSGTLQDALNDGGGNCSGGNSYGDVWYKFTATFTSHIVTVVPGANLDVIVEVYDDGSTCGSLVSAVCIDVPGAGGTETDVINGFTIGNTYYVRVSNFNATSSTPTFTICITSPYAPDPCTNLITLNSGVPETITLSGSGAGWGAVTSLGCSANLTPGAEQVYQFTPPSTGWYTVRTNSVSANPFVYYMFKPVSSGCDATGWTCIGTSNNNTPSININEIYLTGSTPYYILLDNSSTNSTTHTFQIAPSQQAVLPTGSIFPVNGSTLYFPTDGWYSSGVYPSSSFGDLSFNSVGDALMLHFDSEPYKLIYYLEGATANIGTFRIQESSDGQIWSNIITYTNNAPTTFAFYEHLLNVNTRFVRFYKETHNSNAFLDEVAIVKKVDLSCSTAPLNFYDKGGSGGNYGNAEYNVWTIIPSGSGNNVNVQFSSFNLENGFDYLDIRNGNSANSPSLSSNTGTSNPAQQTSSASDGSLTIYMYSDYSTTAAGWAATLNIVNTGARTWTGNGSDNFWNTATNWCGGGVPTSTTNVDIPNVTDDPVVNTTTATCQNITLQTGATLGVNSASAITVNGVFTNNGTVNVANNGNFIQTTGSTLAGSGTFNVTRNATASATVYNYWSTPITSASLGLLGGANYLYNPGNGTADFSDDNPGPDPGWSAASGSFSIGKGYAGKGPNSTVTFTGTANNGTQTAAIQYFPLVNGSSSPGVPYNLVGNIYPSNIDAASFLTANNTKVTGAIYYWDDDNTGGTGYAANDYAIWNGTGSTGGGGRTPNGMIATAQGFFVQALSGATSVSFTNAMRASTATTFFKTEETVPQRLWLRADNGQHTNQILVGYVDGATLDMDWFYDAQKLRGNQTISFYSLLNDTTLLGIQGLAPLNGADPAPVPLGLYAGAAGQNSIFTDSIENFPANMPINLLDADLGIIYDLRNGPYVFQTAQGEDNNRFILFPNELVTAIDEQENLHLNIYPNPNNGSFTVMINSGIEQDVNVSLFDVTGKLVLAADKTISSGNNFIALETQVAGVYMLKVETADKAYIKRVVVY